MQIVAWLRLIQRSWDSIERPALLELMNKESLSAPDTGGRVLLNGTRATPNQVAPLDYSFHAHQDLGDNNAVKYPPYFALVTGSEGAPLSVASGSHVYVGVSASAMKTMGKEVSLRLVFIEPYSVVSVRGDLFHAGAGGEESNGKRCARFHMYMMRDGVAFGDSINEVVGRNMKHNFADTKKTKGELVKKS